MDSRLMIHDRVTETEADCVYLVSPRRADIYHLIHSSASGKQDKNFYIVNIIQATDLT